MEYMTSEAAQYLAERGFTVSRGRIGGKGAPTADTLKHWCEDGKLPGARKRGRYWFIPQEALDALIEGKSLYEVVKDASLLD
jgi:hypothetical protein